MGSFRQLLTEKRDIVMKAKQRYTNGLDKLAFAESQVQYIHKPLQCSIFTSVVHYCFGLPSGRRDEEGTSRLATQTGASKN